MNITTEELNDAILLTAEVIQEVRSVERLVTDPDEQLGPTAVRMLATQAITRALLKATKVIQTLPHGHPVASAASESADRGYNLYVSLHKPEERDQ